MNKTKKTLYCDMDGVLCDFEQRLYELFPHILSMPDGESRAKEIDKCCESELGHRMFSELKQLPGAVWAYKQLTREYNTYILSTPMWGVPHSWMDKRLWAHENLGDEVFKRIILTHNKGLCRGDYLIDDRLKNGVLEFQGEHIHFGQKGFENWVKVIWYLSNKDEWKMDEPPAEFKQLYSK